MNQYSACPIINTYYCVKNLIRPKTNGNLYPDIIRTLDYVNYTGKLEDNSYHQKSLTMYTKLCGLILDYYKVEYPFIKEHFEQAGLLYGIFISDPADNNRVYRGFCGWEQDYFAYRLYINMELVPYFPMKRTFTYLFELAKHEMAHVFLHACDNHEYALENNIHDEAFVEIISDIDNHFYNKNELLRLIS